MVIGEVINKLIALVIVGFGNKPASLKSTFEMELSDLDNAKEIRQCFRVSSFDHNFHFCQERT